MGATGGHPGILARVLYRPRTVTLAWALVCAVLFCVLAFLVHLNRAPLTGLDDLGRTAEHWETGKTRLDDTLRGIETAIGEINSRLVTLVGQVRRTSLLKTATIDGDTTDVEVFGRLKQKAEYNHSGQRNLRPHLGFWAEAGVPLAGELMAGAADPRSNCVALLDRSIAALPDGVEQIRARWDAGYFAAALAQACVERGIEFAIGAKRNTAVVRAAKAAGLHWVPAIGMNDTELAVIDYLPGAWPPAVACIARRTRIPAEKIPTERARKRRTIPKDQLALALEGRIDHVYGYSFILTNLDVTDDEALAEIEWWYRHRTDIEALNKDGKLGAALRHLPSGDHAVNSVWMWAALLACAISAWLQEITSLDYGNGRGRRTVARLRRELICVPARVLRRGGVTWLRLPPGEQLLANILPELQRLPRAG